MPLPSTETLEIHAAELTHDVLRRLIRIVLHAAIKERSHGFYLVLRQVFPVLAVRVALLAVVVVRLR